MGPETEAMLRNIAIGIFAGAVITLLIGFKLVGWTTPTTTQKKIDDAVVASQAAICVAQFLKQPDSKEKVKEFEKMGSNDRAAFIEKGGWDKMPGQEQATFGVSRACVTGLEAPVGK
jgi:hypothetical protein